MENFGRILRRLSQSAVVWSWAFNALRLSSGIFLLPLLLHKLPKPEFSMYYVFLSVIGLTPIIDFGFSSAVGRFVSYATAGATTLQAKGLVPSTASVSGPNRPLLWQLLRTTRLLYRHLALIGLVVMGIWGTVLVHSKVAETGSPRFTWLAWGLALGAATFDIYSTWWNTFLQCMNHVLQSTRIGVISYALRIALTCVLLALGWGLVSLPVGSIAGCLLNRTFSRRNCLRALGTPPAATNELSEGSLLHLMWPNSWRVGVQVLSTYLRTNANIAICVAFFWSATADYGLSVQVINIVTGMAAVWTFVKWPAIGQLRSSQNFEGLRQLIWPRVWLQLLTFLILAAGAIVLGPPLLKLLSTDKRMLPSAWLVWLALGGLLDNMFIFWGTLLSYENRIPTLWPTVATNVASLGLALGLSRFTHLGVFALVLAPLLAGAVFNSWYWPLAGARSIGTTFLRFMLSPPRNVLARLSLVAKPDLTR